MKLKTANLYLFFILLFGLTIVIRVLAEGFHPDSLVYMSMARNLAEGQYSFWNLHFSNTIFKYFYEHPPLGIYTMSLFFSIFGDTILIDKIYGLVFGFLIILEIAAIYRLVTPNYPRNGILLAVFYFLAFPITGYTLENNFLEIPATFFTLAAVFFFLKGSLSKSNSVIYPFLFTTVLVCAFLVKGPVTTFPLASPFFYYLFFSKKFSFKQMLRYYFFIFLFIMLSIILLSSYQPSFHYLSIYFDHQVLASLHGTRNNTDGDKHFKLLSQLFIDFGSIFLVSLIIISAAYKKFFKPSVSPYFWLFMFIGLSASVPLEISPRQSNFYLFPSLPFFAIALSLLFLEPISNALKKFGSYKLIALLNIVLLIAFLTVSWHKSHDYRRYKNFYKDFVEAGIKLPKNAKINVCLDNQTDHYEFFDNTEIPGNLQRYYKAQLFEGNTTTPYFLTTTTSNKNCQVYSKHYQYIGPENPKYYMLYARKNTTSDKLKDSAK